jgi:hypothetical protein
LRQTGASALRFETLDEDAGDETMTTLTVINAGVNQINSNLARLKEVEENHRQAQAAQADKAEAQSDKQIAIKQAQGVAHLSEESARLLEAVDNERSHLRLLAPNFRGAIFNAQIALSGTNAGENPKGTITAEGSADASPKAKQNP